MKKGSIEIAIFTKEDTEKKEEDIIIFENDLLVINPGVIHKIVSFQQKTEILIILTPNIPNDKVIVE